MIVITLGGNAILSESGRGTIEEQIEVARVAMRGVADLLVLGIQVVLSFGNGPIVGNIVVRNEAARDIIPPMPLDVCGADSQGGIGYMLQQVLGNELRKRGLERTVVSVVTQSVVDRNDPAFANPTKPIGPFYSKEEADRLAREKGWTMREEKRRYRRVVPSPKPLQIVEWSAIRALIGKGFVVIGAGGGGIPVARVHGGLAGLEAVIDKDRAAAVLARQLDAERLVILTAVAQVSLDFGKETQRGIDRITTRDARAHLNAGQFPPGNMGPKMEAAIEFVESGGDEAIITSPEELLAAMEGRAGTHVVSGPAWNR
ncbi:MAG TPA: carbamate kinase [bacterium]|nr:carbamate kinase [bacterium]